METKKILYYFAGIQFQSHNNMAQQFGNTWWGNEWLRSLTHIDYENRIPRGARYARNGSVREIQLQDNVISAKVQGSRPRPYRVKIIVPKFSAEQVDKLMDRLVARPGIISGLLTQPGIGPGGAGHRPLLRLEDIPRTMG